MNIYEAKFSQHKDFYVYEYLRSKKSKFGDVGTPYYVGKGKKKRAFSKQHITKPPKSKDNIQISNLMTEADSLQVEMLKISLFGRIDLKTGCLRNKTDGGQGPLGREPWNKGKDITKFLSKEALQKRKQSYTGKNNPFFGSHRTGKSNPFYNKKHNNESLFLIKVAANSRTPKICPQCLKSVDPGNYSKWHGDKCLLFVHRQNKKPIKQ